MQRVISAVLLSIATFIFILVIVMLIVKGETNGHRFYLLLISSLALIAIGWYNYYKNRPKKGTKIID